MALLVPGPWDGQASCHSDFAQKEAVLSAFPRLDILPASQRTLWPHLADANQDSFVLYGGTAVALYLGHRESVDFDFFTHLTFQPLIDN